MNGFFVVYPKCMVCGFYTEILSQGFSGSMDMIEWQETAFREGM